MGKQAWGCQRSPNDCWEIQGQERGFGLRSPAKHGKWPLSEQAERCDHSTSPLNASLCWDNIPCHVGCLNDTMSLWTLSTGHFRTTAVRCRAKASAAEHSRGFVLAMAVSHVFFARIHLYPKTTPWADPVVCWCLSSSCAPWPGWGVQNYQFLTLCFTCSNSWGPGRPLLPPG